MGRDDRGCGRGALARLAELAYDPTDPSAWSGEAADLDRLATPKPQPTYPGECGSKRAGSRGRWRLLDELRALPEPLFIPFHTYYAVLVGKQPFVHRMGVRDVEAALGRPKGLDQAMSDQRFAAVVLDWKSYPGEWPNLDRRYHVIHDFVEGVDSVRMFAGRRPRRVRCSCPRAIRRPFRQVAGVCSTSKMEILPAFRRGRCLRRRPRRQRRLACTGALPRIQAAGPHRLAASCVRSPSWSMPLICASSWPALPTPSCMSA
jgi:hypothetical protein